MPTQRSVPLLFSQLNICCRGLIPAAWAHVSNALYISRFTGTTPVIHQTGTLICGVWSPFFTMMRPVLHSVSKTTAPSDAGHGDATGVQLTSRVSARLTILVFLLLLGSRLSLQQGDPVSNFCRRFGHQTAIVDDRLYIDGGFIDYSPLEQYPENYTSRSPLAPPPFVPPPLAPLSPDFLAVD